MKIQGSFLAKTFATLIVQLLITFLVAYYLHSYDLTALQKWYWVVLMFVCMIAIIFAMSSQIPIVYKLVLFTVFSGIFGTMLSSLSIDSSQLYAAVIGTIGIFVGMFVIGYILTRSGYDLSWMSSILLALLLGLLVSSIVTYAFHIEQKWYYYLGLALFSVYVVFDTNMILRKNYFGDFPLAAMAYYTDIINIFLKLLQLQK